MAYKLKLGFAKYKKTDSRTYTQVQSAYGYYGQDMPSSAELTASTLKEAEEKAKRALNRRVSDRFPTEVERCDLYNGNTKIGSYIKDANGKVVFVPNEYAKQSVPGRYWYVITGTDVHGKRFKRVLSSKTQAMMYNVYRGTLWKEDKSTGKREKIYVWWN